MPGLAGALEAAGTPLAGFEARAAGGTDTGTGAGAGSPDP